MLEDLLGLHVSGFGLNEAVGLSVPGCRLQGL